MKEQPILFSAPMVRAILDGSKTMTRRVVKLKKGDTIGRIYDDKKCEYIVCGPDGDEVGFEFVCPYGVTGDRLWVRETWREMGSIQLSDGTIPKAEQLNADNRHVVYAATDPTEGPFRPSIHMPRWASRITLEVVSVRVERVQEISEADAKAEGLQGRHPGEGCGDCRITSPTAKERFQDLWDSINAKRGYGWDVNPWVWVVEFRRVS